MNDQMYMLKSTISISKENSFKMMEKLSKNSEKIQLQFVNEYALKNYCDGKYFYAVMEQLRYPVKEVNNKYVIAEFNGKLLGSDYEIFLLISEFIDDGFIEMYSEKNGKWRWIFKDGIVKWEFPMSVWFADVDKIRVCEEGFSNETEILSEIKNTCEKVSRQMIKAEDAINSITEMVNINKTR